MNFLQKNNTGDIAKQICICYNVLDRNGIVPVNSTIIRPFMVEQSESPR